MLETQNLTETIREEPRLKKCKLIMADNGEPFVTIILLNIVDYMFYG